MEAVLDIGNMPHFDESVEKLETHTHLPFASTKFGNSDEIRIPFQQPDTYVWPSQSTIYIEGVMTASQTYTLSNNAGAHAFAEIRLEINGVEVDHIKSPGHASTMKGYASFSKDTATRLHSAGWNLTPKSFNQTVDQASGNFNICLPLRAVLGFAEDYDHVLMNVRMELILIRSNRNENMISPVDPSATLTEAGNIIVEITKVAWKLPYVTPSDTQKLRMISILKKNSPIPMAFRSWSLYTYPTLPQIREHTWTLKTSTQLEKPRYVLFGLQTARNNDIKKNASGFDACKLKNVRLYIGSVSFPYDNLNLNFDKKIIAWLYEMYASFQRSYYGRNETRPMLTYDEFIELAPLTVIDCSRQVEAITLSSIDIKLEFETWENIPANTAAYCLILHDQVVTYYPLSGIINKNI